MYQNKDLILPPNHQQVGTVSWQAPSNIAIIKYWGKRPVQLPKNPSLSLSLTNAHTICSISYQPKQIPSPGISMSFSFEGQPNPQFAERLKKYLESLVDIFPFITRLHLDINSRNSFPHSSGIASSASAMCAIALCLCSMEHRFFDKLKDDKAFRRKASFVARLGSGSAARSVFSTAAIWGKTTAYPECDDRWAVGIEKLLHPSFANAKNRIMIVSEAQKAVSSSKGHALMEQNPFAPTRYSLAKSRLNPLLSALQSGDWKLFGSICEQEALDLHALMMSSTPSFILMLPNTLEIINRIRKFRKATKLHLYFTLDAGPNVHILYPNHQAEKVENFLDQYIVGLCERKQYIQDAVGSGPVQLQ